NQATSESITRADSLFRSVLASSDSLSGDIEGAAYEGLADIRFGEADRGADAPDRARLSEAEAYYQRAAAAYESALGQHHPSVAIARLALAYTLYQEGSYERAESVGRQSLADLRQTYGERHPRVMLANYIIGQTLLKAQRFSEAIPYFIAAAEIASAVYPDGHRYTADSWQYVGRARLLAHDGPGAIQAFGNAAAEYDRLGGISDTDRGLFLYWRGRAQMQVGNWSTAI